MRRAIQRLALVAGGAIIGLVAAEGLARLLYERPWYDHLADVQGASERFEYQLNSYGLRDAEFAAPKPEGVRRVYMAGDSFTFGMGVGDRRKIMPSLVEEWLSVDPPIDGIDGVEVLNAGMLQASLPRDWLRKWREVGQAFDPDVVLIVFFLRDGTNTGSVPAFFGDIRREITDRNAHSLFYSLSAGYRIFRDLRDRHLVADRYTKTFQDAYFGTPEERTEWLAAQADMLELKRAAEASGATVGFVVYPILADLGNAAEYPFAAICDTVESFALEHGMPTLNLLPTFLGQHGPDLWVSPLDQHPNETGHAIAAEAITPFLARVLAGA